ncbi:carboxy-S-adenosyl-L-methionine synthase CmoA [Aliarcobacter cibarius]|jgi:tRNA (cmo5U34)-methyltransferase|uniref:Carboxy-S-adenosyl-L-methionine synthase n=1 Tax=Aliarcobacter cibarius TaxID=255507 RepID=A0A5J6RFH2_9BACT|nr:carboxy-S-adenosyl-L-methionine synthase CmoA [Aliarcobacter cibarius]QEZ88585.1 carboxy-S-adenosyl-L-methionine synthase [Aliarcobacter cibarius]QKJ26625.1 carboxy-S-adenosyl-L-methionine synthase [Aliarcobacter cibarius]TLS95234.1 carboxy-S-adenosyl-L-methionine synthase CmoA [Aliarcobacter cibarius]TLS95716.1 carboxy-S-adenosyl-L-methionine synthase CmoA [Aliarcobacter cibarius]TLT02448.1 carboxy-S-adenosyl-L-methionine synthase CmoA [Aliarcobacter cibarius]
MTDKVFNKTISKQFEFDEEVASVFDDMLDRSVPFYKEMQRLSIVFANNFLENGSRVYDLGCSTATTLIELSKNCNKDLKLIGIDNSKAMLERANNKSKAFGVDIKFICNDIFDVDLKDAKVIFSNYTLQFIRPLQREKLVKKIYDGLTEGGVFIFSEKLVSQNSILNKQLIDEYYSFKKAQGYSEFEISQKREALENVLIPYTEDENNKMIKDAGFSHCEMIFKWVNFATFIAIK